MHVSAWFGRREGPPASGVSPIRSPPNRTDVAHRITLMRPTGSHLRARLEVPRPNHGLTTVVTTLKNPFFFPP